jgi:hypothetical protein
MTMILHANIYIPTKFPHALTSPTTSNYFQARLEIPGALAVGAGGSV